MTSLAREAELALLIAEQEADDHSTLVWQREVSLDAKLGTDADSGNFHEFIGRDFFGESAQEVRDTGKRRRDAPTPKQIAYWKYLNSRWGWGTRRIALHVGLSRRTIQYHIAETTHLGTSENINALVERFPIARKAYEDGARLIDIAGAMYEECGYSSPESCYQQLRLVFIEKRVPLRASRLSHGMRAATATRHQRNEYQRLQNANRAKGRGVVQCKSTTKKGERCTRFGKGGVCVVHGKTTRKWTRPVVLAALQAWARQHGRPPRATDWRQASGGAHPNFKTVYSLFGSWPAALEAAGLGDAVRPTA